MKRGDWTCPIRFGLKIRNDILHSVSSRCSFMNFARNAKCLECEEPRPKRQLTGGEWECPQCDFCNYGRNTVHVTANIQVKLQLVHSTQDQVWHTITGTMQRRVT